MQPPLRLVRLLGLISFPVLTRSASAPLWMDAKSTCTFHGLPRAEPGGGLNTIGAGVQSLYHVSGHWTALVTGQVRRIEGDASRSLLVERRTSAYVNSGISYRF